LVTVASAVVAVAPSTPASAIDTEFDCSKYVHIGDVDAQVCWEWYWTLPWAAQWRPKAFYLHSKNASKSLYVLIKTTPTNEPDEFYLGRKDGDASWGVPTSWSWDMNTGEETTTTYVARRLPGRTSDCLATFRHDNSEVRLIRVTGSC
jgi:hypothetical protein